MSGEDWTASYDAVAATADKEGYTLLTDCAADLLNQPFSMEWATNTTLVVTIDVPATRKTNYMTLLEFVALPVRIERSNQSILVVPPHPLLALGEVDDSGNASYFRTLRSDERSGCLQQQGLLMCNNARPSRKREDYHRLPNAERCTMAMFSGDVQTIMATCPAKTVENYDDLVIVDENTVVVVADEPDIAHVDCPDGSFDRVNIRSGLTRVTVRADCSCHTRGGIFYAARRSAATQAIRVDASGWTAAWRRPFENMPHLPVPALSSMPTIHTDFSRLDALIKHHTGWSRDVLLYGGLVLGVATVLGIMVSITCCCRLGCVNCCTKKRTYQPPRPHFSTTSSDEDSDQLTSTPKPMDGAYSRPVEPGVLSEALLRPGEPHPSPPRRRRAAEAALSSFKPYQNVE